MEGRRRIDFKGRRMKEKDKRRRMELKREEGLRWKEGKRYI